MKHSSPIRTLVAAVWLIGVLTLAPPSQAQTEDELNNSLKKSLATVDKALDGSSPPKHVAALSLIGTLKLTPVQSDELIDKLVKFLPQAKSEEVQIAWLLAYGKLFLKPDDNSNDVTWIEQYSSFPDAASSAQRLTPFLSSPSVRVQQAAAESLGNLVLASIQKFEKPILTAPTMDRDFNSEEQIALGLLHPTIPFAAKFELTEFEAALEAYLPLLKTALSSSDSVTLRWALDAVRNLSVSIADNLPDPTVKREKELSINPVKAKAKVVLLAGVLGKIDQLTSKLTPSLTSRDEEVRLAGHRTAESVAKARRHARTTLEFDPSAGKKPPEKIDSDPLLPGLRSLLPTLFSNLKSADPQVRLSAVEALEYYETALWNDRAPVVAATTDSSPFVRWVAARALGKMIPKDPKGGEQTDALSALAKLTTDTDIDVRLSSLNALQRWGVSAQGAAEAVIACVSRGDVDARLAAIATLEAIKPDPNRATSVLVEALAQEDFRVRRAAAATLGRFGDKAKAAVPALEKVLFDADPELRRIAGEAILAIE